MANEYPFVKNLNGAAGPLVEDLPVQAGSTQAISKGNIIVHTKK